MFAGAAACGHAAATRAAASKDTSRCGILISTNLESLHVIGRLSDWIGGRPKLTRSLPHGFNHTDHRLPAGMHMDVLNTDELGSAVSQSAKGLDLGAERL